MKSEKELFSIVGMISPEKIEKAAPRPKKRVSPSAVIMAVIIILCVFSELIMTKDPSYMDLNNCAHAPGGGFIFGTDTLGRDIFSCIWYGGRASLFIGFFSTVISTFIAVVYGSISGAAPQWVDTVMMRFVEIFLSIPSLLTVIFLQAIMGGGNIITISIVIGITSWCSIAKVVRTEVRQLRQSDYILAAQCMGGGFFHILRRHLAPNFVSSVMYMVVMNVRSAIAAESTLSFMGLGLPLEIISWGSMLSLAQNALMTNAWWIIVFPGAFLITLMLCLTNVGNNLRKSVNEKESNL